MVNVALVAAMLVLIGFALSNPDTPGQAQGELALAFGLGIALMIKMATAKEGER